MQLEEMDRGFQWHTKIYVLASMLDEWKGGRQGSKQSTKAGLGNVLW